MDYIRFVFNVLITVAIYIVFIKVLMIIAEYIGKKIGISKFIIAVWNKMKAKLWSGS
jgi:hypothetical protein